jgi:murein DD-endopeptidase MepM/ murein hydrolase activator NlpD
LPKEKLRQVVIPHKISFREQKLTFQISNPIHCSIEVSIKSKNQDISEEILAAFPFQLPAFADTTLVFKSAISDSLLGLSLVLGFGNHEDSLNLAPLLFPFSQGKSYQIMQGNNGTFSHTDDYSRYAIDFSLAVNDTICAVADAYVVGVIKDYKHGKNNRNWRDYANYITLFHPKQNCFTQYVHLVENGSFVQIGDSVLAGQAIGLAGKTGYTSKEHLHFNVLAKRKDGMKSIPHTFVGNIESESLKQGDLVSH